MNGTCCCVELTVTEDAEVLLSVAEDSQVALDVEEQFVTGGGITPSGTKEISATQNGTTNTDVTYYANAKVVANVPNTYTASDEDKVVQDGALEAQTTATFEANDTYDTTTIKQVTVDVPASAVDSGYVYIDENDTVDVVGYAQAVVNVPNTYKEYDEGKVVSNGELVVQTSATVRQNGRIDTTLINSLMVNVSSGGRDMTPEQKDAILALAEKVAYIDDDGQELYEALQNAFYPPSPLASISAVYTQSGTVYPSTSLDSLKSDLVVTATYEDQSSETIPSTDYTLSGTLSVGTSTVTVTYEEETTTFSVTVSAVPTVVSISADYTQSGTVYDTDSLDSLKSDLVVTATWSDTSSSTVASTDYTLSGTLTVGTSTITVTYEGETDTFSVTVSSSVPTYVTSGLISRWDAIDNTANGHDDSATTWKDLVGSHDLVMHDSTKASFGSDYLLFAGQANQYLADTSSGFGSNAVTVEICMELSSSTDTQYLGWFGQSGLQRVIAAFSDNTVMLNGTSSKTYSTGLTGITYIKTISAVYDSNASTGTIKCNNVVCTQSNTTHSFSTTTNYNTVRIGNQMGTSGNYQVKGKIHAIRVYSRQLTDAEQTQNYNTDLARFFGAS